MRVSQTAKLVARISDLEEQVQNSLYVDQLNHAEHIELSAMLGVGDIHGERVRRIKELLAIAGAKVRPLNARPKNIQECGSA